MEKLSAATAISLVKEYLLNLQNCLCQFVEQEEDGAQFIEDKWDYKDGGGGITRILNAGHIIEKAGVNFSHVSGAHLPPAATAKRPELANAAFQALGVSVVIHPQNPFVPTSHFNGRFIVVETNELHPVWWFGGGFDLTPYYGFTEDCIHWHQTAKAACDSFGPEVYPKFKKWADNYFFLQHRNEPRGIGGIFYDDVNQWSFADCFAFMRSVGDHYIKAYQPILAKRKRHVFGEQERRFQLYRRGRYVEFNLLYDRGTLFGLQSGGRTESILMSLPPLASWQYAWQPESESPEAKLKEFLFKFDWV